MADQQKVVCDVSNGVVFNDFEQPPNPVFKVTLFFDAEWLWTVKDTAIVTMEGE